MRRFTKYKDVTYILWPAKTNAGNRGNLLQSQAEKGLAGFAFRARLNLLEGSIGGRILFMVMVMVMVMFMAMIVALVGGMVMNLFDRGHSVRRNAPSVHLQ